MLLRITYNLIIIYMLIKIHHHLHAIILVQYLKKRLDRIHFPLPGESQLCCLILCPESLNAGPAGCKLSASIIRKFGS